jgi:hypothetical protein
VNKSIPCEVTSRKIWNMWYTNSISKVKGSLAY